MRRTTVLLVSLLVAACGEAPAQGGEDGGGGSGRGGDGGGGDGGAGGVCELSGRPGEEVIVRGAGIQPEPGNLQFSGPVRQVGAGRHPIDEFAWTISLSSSSEWPEHWVTFVDAASGTTMGVDWSDGRALALVPGDQVTVLVGYPPREWYEIGLLELRVDGPRGLLVYQAQGGPASALSAPGSVQFSSGELQCKVRNPDGCGKESYDLIVQSAAGDRFPAGTGFESGGFAFHTAPYVLRSVDEGFCDAHGEDVLVAAVPAAD